MEPAKGQFVGRNEARKRPLRAHVEQTRKIDQIPAVVDEDAVDAALTEFLLRPLDVLLVPVEGKPDKGCGLQVEGVFHEEGSGTPRRRFAGARNAVGLQWLGKESSTECRCACFDQEISSRRHGYTSRSIGYCESRKASRASQLQFQNGSGNDMAWQNRVDVSGETHNP